MKLAITGKGGVGKTTLAALLGRALRDRGYSVLLVDADPDANLGSALGFPHPEELVPISEMKDLIAERTGSRPGSLGGFFKLNPTVADLPEKLARSHQGLKLMVLGTVKAAGGGCICPESSLLKALLNHLFLNHQEAVIMDMEAGLEHLGRGTAMGVDMMIVVVEPGRRSLDTAAAIKGLAGGLGIKKLGVVASKVQAESELVFLKDQLRDFLFLGQLPWSESIRQADLQGQSLLELPPAEMAAINPIVDLLEKELNSG